jgi:hypothetical protein
VERVRQRRADSRKELDRVDRERRLAASRARGRAGRADHVAEVEVDLAHAAGVAQQLDPAGAVDEVEKDELAHVPACHHAPGDAALLRGFLAVAERLDLGPHRGDLDAVGKALGHGHGRRVYFS